jgi:predicted ribosomally synthesized peptide with nif11-like leader
MQSLREFRVKVDGSEALPTAIRNGVPDLDAIVEHARPPGFQITRDEIRSTTSNTTGERSDFELELVNAGNGTDRFDHRAGAYFASGND